MGDLDQDAITHKGFSTYQGNLMFKGRLVIPSSSTLLPKIMVMYYNSPIGGHAGEKKTYMRVATEIFWQGMWASIIEYVKKCMVFQTHKALTTSPMGLLQPIP